MLLILTYLGVSDPPNAWKYKDWIQAGLFLFTTLAAWMRLPKGSPPPETIPTPGRIPTAPIILLAVVLPLASCAPKGVVFDAPTTETMYRANDAMKDLGKIRDFAWDLYGQRILSVSEVRVTIQMIDVADAALEKAGGGWRDVASTAAWEAAVKIVPELGPMPSTWQEGARSAWRVAKLKVPALTRAGGWSVLAGAVDGALDKLGG
ncbi:hypothetical protein LLG88_13600 [bacterium]|nr:hypothetical protein [bacterium]